ncbi:MAG TPA: vanadium-dependent haloperoxidase, partial [Archangium sp.]|nr:vanadium-dependent haloperoxidase [Archangium sp.]
RLHRLAERAERCRPAGRDQFDQTQRRFIRNLRDGANYVHFDQVVNAWWNAAFFLLSEPRGNQNLGNAAGTGRPQVDMEFSFNRGNPYDPPGTAEDARRQVGFTTFGPVHLLQLLNEVAGRAGRAVWWQKWGVHRRLRPEEYGGRIDNQLNNRRTYPLHASILTSLSTGGLAPYFPERYGVGSYLLPQAYPEGSPTHPAYGAGHATISGACATLLKAFFDESAPVESPVVANADGTSLVSYTGADAAQLTVGGELNKLAGNISLFRNAAGVHWRSDYTDSLPLGEKVAIGLLQELSLTFNEEDAFFQFTRFDGVTVRIHHGIVESLV